MNVKSKSTIILILTLVLGIIIGAAGGGLFRDKIFRDRLSSYRSPERFINKMIHVINPDSVQQVQIKDILKAHHNRMDSVGIKFRQQADTLNSQFRKEMKQVLTPEQQRNLDNYFEKMTQWHRERNKRPERRRSR